MMTNEEKLNKQLQITTLAIVRMQDKALNLSYMVQKEDVDKRNAFDDLLDWIARTSVKAQKAVILVEKEYKEASDDSKAEGNER